MKFFSITNFSIFLLLPVFFSCSVSKPTYYFKDIKRDTVINNTAFNFEELKIKKTDILNISISSLSKEEDAIFTRQETLSAASTGTSAAAGFPVDINGNIHLHKLGKVKAEGMTRNELKNSLEKQLQPFLKDPVVAVNFANHYITVVGEVGKPQLLNMPDERMSIMDMVAQSGNINAIAELNNLMVIRDHQSSKEFKHINLEDNSIFTSPWYYLQPNDVVVVNPDEKRVIQKEKRDRYQQTASIIFQALSIVIIITQIFKN
jgi:polysaccharide biosynthesis/export protein